MTVSQPPDISVCNQVAQVNNFKSCNQKKKNETFPKRIKSKITFQSGFSKELFFLNLFIQQNIEKLTGNMVEIQSVCSK